MAKERRPAVDFAVYGIVRLMVCLLQGIPMAWGFAFARFLGWLAYRLDKRHRQVATENLKHAFPELQHQPQQCDRLVRACFHHFATMIIEIIYAPRKMHLHTWRNFGDLIGGEHILKGVLGQRSLLIVTAHFGNWEIAGYILGMVGIKSYAIARTLDNPYLEKFFKGFRQKTGQTILAKVGDYDKITEVLAKGGTIATLGDQDAGTKGLFVEFFHRPASTHKAVALLALEYEPMMLVIGIPRVRTPMFYHVIVQEVIDPRDYKNQPDAVRKLTERYTQAIEQLVRKYPEQYFWLHRRWKHKPPEKKKKEPAPI
jgi:KDO2-lipid IV(A) lauroyltransferase